MRNDTKAEVKMNDDTANAAEIHRQDMLADLERLVEALDRRVPRLERLGEAEIVREAASLRQKAIALSAKLTNSHGHGS